MAPAVASNEECGAVEFCHKAVGDCEGEGICFSFFPEDVACVLVVACGCDPF